MELKNKIVVITGGASGIGLSSSEQLLLNDITYLAILDLPSPSAEASVAKITKQFGENRVGFFPCDVTSDEQVNSTFDKIMDLFGSFDILVNCAAILNETHWNRMIDVNFTGVVRTTLKAIDLIGKHKGGKGGLIVNIASLAALVPVHYVPLYAATKHGVMGLTRNLQLSYERHGVLLQALCPGLTHTPMVPFLHTQSRRSYVDVEKAAKEIEGLEAQVVECVSTALIQVIEKGDGTVCIASDGKPPYLIDIPSVEDLPKRPL